MRHFTSAALACLLVTSMLILPVSANSAQSFWEGTTAAGAIVPDEDCPIVVEQELLTFDLQEFPDQHYGSTDDYLAYTGKVTAEYTFRNPADYDVTAVLVFPFGTVPDYGYIRDEDTDDILLNADTDKYDVTVDGAAVEKTLRHTYVTWGEQFDLDTGLDRLYDGFREDEFFSPDMTVCRYTYQPAADVDTETYRAANAGFVLSADRTQTRVLVEGASGGRVLDDGVLLSCWVSEGTIVVNVIGEPLEQAPEWKFYENGACETEIAGTMDLISTETITLKDLALREYDGSSGVLDYDWYNAFLEQLDYYEWSYGAYSGSEIVFDLSQHLMRWYQYEIGMGAGETITNTVTAPIYPSFNLRYDPPIYEYTYLLSPAQSWAAFGTLDAEIHTPYCLVESETPTFSVDGGSVEFEKTDTGYALHLTSLPDGELTFVLSEDEFPETESALGLTRSLWWIGFAVGLIVALAVGAIILLLVHRKRKKA